MSKREKRLLRVHTEGLAFLVGATVLLGLSLVFLYILVAVSYTHLTLPTNREV